MWLDATLAHYNRLESLDGQWYAFIGGPDGKMVGHLDLSKTCGDTRGLFGGETFHTYEEGKWPDASPRLRLRLALPRIGERRNATRKTAYGLATEVSRFCNVIR